MTGTSTPHYVISELGFCARLPCLPSIRDLRLVYLTNHLEINVLHKHTTLNQSHKQVRVNNQEATTTDNCYVLKQKTGGLFIS